MYQEALQRLAGRWSRVDNPRAFARRVITNLVVDGVRARARRPAEQALLSSHDVADPRTAATQERIEVRGALLEAMAVLTATQRAVLALRYLEDVSEAEVAALLGVSVGTVKSTASRAIDRLETHPALVPLRTPTDNG